MKSIHRLLPSLLCAASLAACTPAPLPAPGEPQPSRGRLVTAEEIRRSGARTAWQVLERQPALLRTGLTAEGRVTARSGRGRAGPPSSGEPMLVVDGAHMTDLDVLRSIPAESIRSMEFLSGVAAPLFRGPGSENGVIVVRTAPPAPR